MIWLASKLFGALFGGLAPLLHFLGDHRYGTIALLLVVAAGAAWVYVPVVGRQTAKALLVVAVAAGFYDGGYSHRAAIDRAAWAQVTAARKAAEDAERARIDQVLDRAHQDSEAKAASLTEKEAENERLLEALKHASKANDHRPCLDRASVVRLDNLRRRAAQVPGGKKGAAVR